MMQSRGGSVNPFKMPTDADVFVLRDEEKRQRAIERDRIRHLSVQEKTTRSTAMGSAKPGSIKELGHADADGSYAAGDTRGASATQASSVPLPSIDKRVKDNMTLFITKKRKLGLERMSLATKRQEIKKLDEEAEHAEKRVEQMQAQLKETDEKFTQFLRKTEMEHKEAHTLAETESKQKQERVQEIKKLSAQIAQIETEKKKNEEMLRQCMEYKEFLDKLAPVDWMASQLIKLRKEDAEREIAAQLDQRYDAMPEPTEAEEIERQEAKKAELEELCRARFAAIEAEVHAFNPEDADDALRAELDRYDVGRLEMYFKDPDDLLTKFIEIEEGNLFLITTCQEYEEEIEAIQSQYKHRRQEMADLAKAQHSHMDQIRRQIAAESAKLKALEERIARAGNQKAQDVVREQIASKIRSIYERIQIGDDAANVGTLGSLTAIEVKLDELRMFITNEIDDRSFVTKKMKEYDKERRAKVRQALLNQHREQREERSRAALARAQAPVKKRVGKPVMWRSRPLDQKKHEVTTTVETNMNDDEEFFQ